MRIAILTVLLCAAACSAEEPRPSTQILVMQALGDFDGDGVEDRAEFWVTPSSSRLLVFRAAEPGVATLLNEGPTNLAIPYVRTRNAATIEGACCEIISFGHRDGQETLFYWDGDGFAEATP